MLTVDVHTPVAAEVLLSSSVNEGVALIVDKPFGWTSFDVVKVIRKKLRHLTGSAKCKVGHCGTLDPMASGLLILCLGKATKQIDRFQGMDKEYRTEVRLGAVTKSNDRETEETDSIGNPDIDIETIHTTLTQFVGELQQIPPMHSAIRKDGTRLYELARMDVEIERDPRMVTIHSIDDIEWESPYLRFTVRCSKGTYIRSLARDIGISLGCGGYLYNLRRTMNGSISITDALSIGDALDMMNTKKLSVIHEAEAVTV